MVVSLCDGCREDAHEQARHGMSGEEVVSSCNACQEEGDEQQPRCEELGGWIIVAEDKKETHEQSF